MHLNAKRYRPTVAIVELGRLAQNAKRLYEAMGRPAFFCPMVKANAYGHGDIEVTKKLRKLGVARVGVGLIEEAIHLRQNGDSAEILHFGMFDLEGAEAILEFGITPVISSIEEIHDLKTAIRKTRLTKACEIHLKINTGMNRLGLEPKLAKEAAKVILADSSLKLVGVATHFATGETLSASGSSADKQLKQFLDCVTEIQALGAKDFFQHIANSAAARELNLIGRVEFGCRPGLSLYGIEMPSQLLPEKKVLGLEPVLRLESKLVHIQHVVRGGQVSYGGTWTCDKDSLIGVVPIGYADGYHRGLGGSSVLIRGRRLPVVGIICMDYFMVDLTELGGQTKVGERVVLIGEDQGSLPNGQMFRDEITAIELANRLGSIPYEILTSLSERVPRLYNDDPQSARLL